MKKATKILITLGAVLFVLVEAGALFAMYRLGQSTARPAIPADAMIFSGELLEASGGPETSRTVLLIDNGQDGYIQAVHLQEDTVILGEDGAPMGVESLIPGRRSSCASAIRSIRLRKRRNPETRWRTSPGAMKCEC